MSSRNGDIPKTRDILVMVWDEVSQQTESEILAVPRLLVRDGVKSLDKEGVRKLILEASREYARVHDEPDPDWSLTAFGRTGQCAVGDFLVEDGYRAVLMVVDVI